MILDISIFSSSQDILLSKVLGTIYIRFAHTFNVNTKISRVYFFLKGLGYYLVPSSLQKKNFDSLTNSSTHIFSKKTKFHPPNMHSMILFRCVRIIKDMCACQCIVMYDSFDIFEHLK